MKRWLPLSVILLAGLFAVIAVQRNRIDTRSNPQAILTAAADAQHELTRIPAHVDRMSDADEIALGNQLAANYAVDLPSTLATKGSAQPSPLALEHYLQSIADRAATHTRRHLPWRVHYIANPNFVNAFALPGGHVFIGQGLLSLMHSEDALAAVLGHEIEHIDLRHCADRAQIEAHLRNLGSIGALAGLPVELFLAGYSKEQELEADRDGTTLAVDAGYSPQGILQLFTEFARLENSTRQASDADPVTEAMRLSLDTLQGYFQSHPPSIQRSQQVRSLIAAQHWPSPPLTCLRYNQPAPNPLCAK
jgi:predicted Zn-dependent protease